jgi:hypothetical protein
MKESAHIHPFPRLSKLNGLYFLGLVWFYTLLVNKKQDIETVYNSLGELTNTLDIIHQPPFDQIIKESSIQTFVPENIFWNPGEKVIAETCHCLWERSLSLGWSLLETSLNPDSKWSKDEFYQKLEALREDAKNNLFLEKPSKETKDYPIEHEAIHNILMKILDKWQKNIKAQTVDIKTKEIDKQKPSEILDKTVIISPKNFQEKQTGPDLKEEKTGEKILEETIVFSPEVSRKKTFTHDAEKDTTEKEELEKTVIISPSKDFKGSSEPSQGHPVQLEKDKDKEKKSSEQEAVNSKKDDFFTETIILSPDQIKENEKDENNE